MTWRGAVSIRRLEFDFFLDEWPNGAQGQALQSLVASGDVVATPLPHGFVGLTIRHTRMMVYVEAGRLHVKQVLPPPIGPAPSTAVPVPVLDRIQDSRF